MECSTVTEGNLTKTPSNTNYEDPLNPETLTNETDTWQSYTWRCSHCGKLMDNLEDLRSHSKKTHSMCHAFTCADCDKTFIIFDQFVDHVWKHRDGLRLSCQFCNSVFPTLEESQQHINSHYVGTQKICDLCGESLPFQNTLEWHKRLYGQIPCGQERRKSNSWDSYDWRCQECPLLFSDVQSLRTHAQRAHGRCFAMRCADCSRPQKCYKTFVAHVITHRPYLQNFCQYCNSHHRDTNELNQHIIQHITSQQRPCNICGQMFTDNSELAEHKRLFNSPKKTGAKGLPNSKQSKKKEKIVKRKEKATRSEAARVEDLKCNICGKRFTALPNLMKHTKIHDHTRPRNFTCQICGRAFLTAATLRDHVLTHNSVKPEVCQVCNKGFYTKHKLKAHIITHSELRPFVCSECGNGFKTKRRLKCHLVSHSDVKPFSCTYCKKEFKFKENLKTHLHQHTGARPYRCEVCERTFTNWTNCNKHMIRKHGVTLARTKITSQGRIAIDRKTGQVGTLASDRSTMEWLDRMMQPERPGKRTGNDNPQQEF